jgi:hypothetical protein
MGRQARVGAAAPSAAIRIVACAFVIAGDGSARAARGHGRAERAERN